MAKGETQSVADIKPAIAGGIQRARIQATNRLNAFRLPFHTYSLVETDTASGAVLRRIVNVVAGEKVYQREEIRVPSDPFIKRISIAWHIRRTHSQDILVSYARERELVMGSLGASTSITPLIDQIKINLGI